MAAKLQPQDALARLEAATVKAQQAAADAREATRACHEATRAAKEELARIRQEGHADLQRLLDETTAATAKWEGELRSVLRAERSAIQDLAADLVVKTLEGSCREVLEEIQAARDRIMAEITTAVEDLVARDNARTKAAKRVSVIEFMEAREVMRRFAHQSQEERAALGDEMVASFPGLLRVEVEDGP